MSNILRTTLKHPLGKRAPLASLSRYVSDLAERLRAAMPLRGGSLSL